jgi:thiamine monophosphate synthase
MPAKPNSPLRFPYAVTPDAAACPVDLKPTGERRIRRGVEIYTFRDKEIATKDVYRKLITTDALDATAI